MKRIFSFAFAVVLAVSCCMSMALAAGPLDMRASLTLASYSSDLEAGNSRGVISIGYTVNSNKLASAIGVESIVIYTEDGDYVATITGTTRNGLIRTSSSIHKSTYEYKLTSGVFYYAEVTVFAEVGAEYDSRTITTNTVKAP